MMQKKGDRENISLWRTSKDMKKDKCIDSIRRIPTTMRACTDSIRQNIMNPMEFKDVIRQISERTKTHQRVNNAHSKKQNVRW